MNSADCAGNAGATEACQDVPTQEGYDRWAEFYDGEDNPLVLLEEQHIGNLVGDVTGLTVADVGCGTGRHALRLAAQGARVTAVDFSEGMLEQARRKPGAEKVSFILHDAHQPLPLANGTVDLVLCCLVGEHIADLPRFFAELRRICRTGAPVVFSAMHPAMMLRGVHARFIDPATGIRIGPQSHPHQVSDYVMAAVHAGLALDHLSEYAVDSNLAERSPRSRRYLGWPMLLLMRLRNSQST